MKKCWLVLAVLLAGNVAVCRADGYKINWRALFTYHSTADAAGKETVVPATARDVKKDDGKDYVEPVDAKDVAAAPVAVAAPKPDVNCAASTCCRSSHVAQCCRHLCDWLTYRPLSRPGCCHKCGGCHVPPLYLYFLDPYHACAPGNGCATCAAPGCAGCAHP